MTLHNLAASCAGLFEWRTTGRHPKVQFMPCMATVATF